MNHKVVSKIAPGVGIAILAAAILLGACAGPPGDTGSEGPQGPPGPQGPAGPAGEDADVRLEYVGSEQCAECHAAEYAKFTLSGHPYPLTEVDGVKPEYPYDDRTGGVDDPPEGYTWEDVSYVVGGYAWKALFLDQDGYIITGGGSATQLNFVNEAADLDGGFVPYHAGEQVPYDCGSCHTTGYSPVGRQNDMAGIVGTWALEGVQCEACHGPGSLHSSDPSGHLMVLDRSNQLCADCHATGAPGEIDAAGGFTGHYVQYDELFNSKHFALQCIACHDPHASSVFGDAQLNPDAGLIQRCESCHWQEEAVQNSERHLALSCTDCHMPPAGLSALGSSELVIGDLSSHLFSINPDPSAPQFNQDGTVAMPYLTLEYACGHCHNDAYANVKAIELLAERASGYHTPPTPTPEPAPPADAEPEG
jgi:predicted CXXCH cytochrome family protein